MDEQQEQSWILRYDWSHPGPDARDSRRVTERLSAFLQRAGGMRGREQADEVATQFGRYVRALRNGRGWQGLDLAREAEIDPMAVPLLEAGALTRDELTTAVVGRIARAFGWVAADLAINPCLEPPVTALAAGGFGAWLQRALPGVSCVVTRPAYSTLRGGGSPDTAAERECLLVRPLALPECAVMLSTSESAQLIPMLEPVDVGRQEADAADCRVRVVDNAGEPCVGLFVVLELEGLPYWGEGPTDKAGVAWLLGLSLADLLASDALRWQLHRMS